MIIGMSLAGTIGRKSRPARHVRPSLQFRRSLHVRLRQIGIMLTAFAAGLLREVRAWQVPDAETAERDARNRRAGRYFDVYGNAVLRLAYSYVHNMADAEDILQETLIRIMKADPQFANEAQEKAYILKTAANAAKNHLAYSRLREADELNEELLAEEREDLSFVWEAVKQLPEISREALHLYYCEGYKTAEIAGMLGRREATVRSDLKRARERLKEILKEEYDFE